MRISNLNLFLVVILALPAQSWAQQSQEAIDIEAATSIYDRQNGRLEFTDVRITQGAMSIRADAAQADELQFDNASWRFTGDVRLTLDGNVIAADEATIEFAEHSLTKAAIAGMPATIQGRDPNSATPVNGRATRMEYDRVAGTIRLVGDAWISEGRNQISGSTLLYDINTETVIAGDPDSATQDVTIVIQPPDKDDDDAPGVDPGTTPSGDNVSEPVGQDDDPDNGE